VSAGGPLRADGRQRLHVAPAPRPALDGQIAMAADTLAGLVPTVV